MTKKIAFYPFLLAGMLIGSCSVETSREVDPRLTKKVLDHHWEAFKENDLEEVMADYTEESFLITPDTTYKGLDAIRENFIKAFESLPSEEDPLTLRKSVVEEDIGYIIWEASASNMELLFGTDTFLIRNGKIIRQTFGGITQQQLD